MGATRPIRPGHAGLVGLPLFLTVLFCLALVLAHPHQTFDTSARDSDISADKASIGKDSQVRSKLSSSTSSSSSTQAVMTTLSPVQTPTDNPPIATPPQPGKSTGQDLQSSGQQDQPLNSIIYKVTQPVRQTLTRSSGLPR